MNTKTILSLVFVASILFTSCKKELEPQDSSETPLTETTAAPTTAPANAQAIQAPAPTSTPVPVTPTPQSATAAATKTAPGMNPPHGQPNHRCDIAVGAPLNSPKGQTPPAPPAPKPATTVQKVTPPQPTNAAVTPTAPGMNPPHGQPGHRCEIAVGAPLPTS